MVCRLPSIKHCAEKDAFPLPLVDECLDTLTGNIRFAKLDAKWAYLQLKVKDSDEEKTALFPSRAFFNSEESGVVSVTLQVLTAELRI